MKKGIIVLIAMLLLLIPVPRRLKNGGSISYIPISFIYEVRIYNADYDFEDGTYGRLKGTEILVLGKEVYSKNYTVRNQ